MPKRKKNAFKEDGFKRLPGRVHHKELGHQSRKTRKQFTLPQYRISGHNKRDLIQRTFDCQFRNDYLKIYQDRSSIKNLSIQSKKKNNSPQTPSE